MLSAGEDAKVYEYRSCVAVPQSQKLNAVNQAKQSVARLAHVDWCGGFTTDKFVQIDDGVDILTEQCAFESTIRRKRPPSQICMCAVLRITDPNQFMCSVRGTPIIKAAPKQTTEPKQ